MIRSNSLNRKIVWIGLVAALFIAAQLGVALHKHKHDSDISQASVCAICVIAGHMDDAAVDHSIPLTLILAKEAHTLADFTSASSGSLHETRQRGPPTLL